MLPRDGGPAGKLNRLLRKGEFECAEGGVCRAMATAVRDLRSNVDEYIGVQFISERLSSMADGVAVGSSVCWSVVPAKCACIAW